jgi:hypothetical protein
MAKMDSTVRLPDSRFLTLSRWQPRLYYIPTSLRSSPNPTCPPTRSQGRPKVFIGLWWQHLLSIPY